MPFHLDKNVYMSILYFFNKYLTTHIMVFMEAEHPILENHDIRFPIVTGNIQTILFG